MKRDPAMFSNIKLYADDFHGVWTEETARLLDLSLESPRFASAPTAHWVRDDDQVLGILFRGEARAYPFWIWDYHHVVNDEWMGYPIFVAG